MKSLTPNIGLFLSAIPLLTGALLMAGCNGDSKKSVKDTDKKPESTKATANGDGESKGVGQWANQQWNNAISAGSDSVDGTNEWIGKLYQSAKQAGTTTANSTAEWVSEDWQAQGDWEYQIVQLPSDDIASLQTQLNEAGRSRWECYHVDTTGQQWTFFMKRNRHSYLSKVPLRDLADILPIGGDGQ